MESSAVVMTCHPSHHPSPPLLNKRKDSFASQTVFFDSFVISGERGGLKFITWNSYSKTTFFKNFLVFISPVALLSTSLLAKQTQTLIIKLMIHKSIAARSIRSGSSQLYRNMHLTPQWRLTTHSVGWLVRERCWTSLARTR